jgi:hypothetical protein
MVRRLRTGYKKYNIEEFEDSKKGGVWKLVLWSKKTGKKLRTVTSKTEIRRILSGK